MRIQMVQSKRVQREGGGAQEFLSGRFYLVSNKQAKEWIAGGAAVDPDAPPPEPAEPVPASDQVAEPVPEPEKAGEV